VGREEGARERRGGKRQVDGRGKSQKGMGGRGMSNPRAKTLATPLLEGMGATQLSSRLGFEGHG